MLLKAVAFFKCYLYILYLKKCLAFFSFKAASTSVRIKAVKFSLKMLPDVKNFRARSIKAVLGSFRDLAAGFMRTFTGLSY